MITIMYIFLNSFKHRKCFYEDWQITRTVSKLCFLYNFPVWQKKKIAFFLTYNNYILEQISSTRVETQGLKRSLYPKVIRQAEALLNIVNRVHDSVTILRLSPWWNKPPQIRNIGTGKWNVKKLFCSQSIENVFILKFKYGRMYEMRHCGENSKIATLQFEMVNVEYFQWVIYLW